MRIDIIKQDLPIKEKRKLKLLKIDDQNVDENQFGYGFKIQNESDDESLKDFHLFCVSIVRDLVKNRFKTNEKGLICYDLSNINIDSEELLKLYDLIKSK